MNPFFTATTFCTGVKATKHLIIWGPWAMYNTITDMIHMNLPMMELIITNSLCTWNKDIKAMDIHSMAVTSMEVTLQVITIQDYNQLFDKKSKLLKCQIYQ